MFVKYSRAPNAGHRSQWPCGDVCHTVRHVLLSLCFCNTYVFFILPYSFVTICRYDVELYQRIEALLGKKLPAFPAEQDTVLMLLQV